MKIFKICIVILLLFNSSTINAQINLGNAAGSLLKKALAGTPPTGDEMGSALKEALALGVSAGSDRLSAENGFMGNSAVKILFPQEAQRAERALRNLGMKKLCDDLVLSLNRAAELAAKEAKPIFIEAIKQMTLKDASGILLSTQQDAATQYFKNVTVSQLSEKFKPIIQASLDKVGAGKYWADVTTNYNKIPSVKQINTDLVDYTTQQAIAGLFVEIAKEEAIMRNNTFLRDTPLLKKVFGYADKAR